MLPLVGVSRAPSKLSSVDLPLPLFPTMETNWPESIVKLISWSAVTLPWLAANDFSMFVTCSIKLLYSDLNTSAGRTRAINQAGTALPMMAMARMLMILIMSVDGVSVAVTLRILVEAAALSVLS